MRRGEKLASRRALKQTLLVHCSPLLVTEAFLFFRQTRAQSSRHNFQAGRNMRKATEGGGAFIQTLPVKMTDYLGGRTVKSQFGTQAPLPPRLHPTNLQASLPLGCSKCIIIKIPPVDGLQCNFQVAHTETPHRCSTSPQHTLLFPAHRWGILLNCYDSCAKTREFSRIKQMNCGESVA